ncbi:LysR family transcriptional regulator substrate-binding protein [Granulicatella elegans]|uniref:LysR family transcriptional regulator substrate-binding protein n=1 Tax=Granulicatella elegans TaxID=137732 RepID=UPI00223E75AA|nr:LysR family transcriptional regulator substrate-binding protein [Granulicatella elegans]
MVQGGSYELQQKLAKGEIDLGILSFPKYEATITLEPFLNPKLGYDISIVVSKNHILANRNSLTFEELTNQSFSTLPNQYILGQFLHSQAKK